MGFVVAALASPFRSGPLKAFRRKQQHCFVTSADFHSIIDDHWPFLSGNFGLSYGPSCGLSLQSGFIGRIKTANRTNLPKGHPTSPPQSV